MIAMFDGFDLVLTMEQARSASRPGDCTADVAALLTVPAIRRQLQKLLDVELRAELQRYGAWSEEELADRAANEARVIWIAAGQITEEAATRGRKG